MLTPMRYKDYTFPHNPATYSITYRRIVQSDKVPFAFYRMQSLGLSYRVMSGEGAFVGEGAYDNFRELATVFYSDGPGMLIHPVWQPANAHFVSLELIQEPRPDYVAYRFEFWEDTQKHNGSLSVSPSTPGAVALEGTRIDALPRPDTPSNIYVVQESDTIWAIAAKNNTTVQTIAKNNPKLRKLVPLKSGFHLLLD